MFKFSYLCVVVIKIYMVMKAKRKFTWVIRYYNVMEGVITYRICAGITVDEVNWLADTFLESHKDYELSIFKLRKNCHGK